MMIRINTSVSATDETLKALVQKLHIPGSADIEICSPEHISKADAAVKIVVCAADEKEPLRRSYGDDIHILTLPIRFSAFADIVTSLSFKEDENDTDTDIFSFDPATGIITKGELRVTLTPKESELFEYLLKSRSRAVSREELRRALWRNTTDTNAPDVYISYLRRKLRVIFGDGVLVNEREIGYILKNIM